MIGAIAKSVAYTKAPRVTFMALHPRTALRLRKMRYDLKHAYAPRVAALGVAAVAVPLGIWIGRRGNGRGPEKE